MYVCLSSPAWSTGGVSSTGEAALLLADRAPRLRADRDVIWADGRGLNAVKLAAALVERLAVAGIEARAGVAAVPVVAHVAAAHAARAHPGGGGASAAVRFTVKERTGWGHRRPDAAVRGGAAAPAAGGVVAVEQGGEAEWLAARPVGVLAPEPRLLTLLDGVGITTVGGLAALDREAVEVRFGADAVSLWRLARCDDRRVLFRPAPPERPHGSIDFVDYVLTDPARLLFTANALLGPLCDRLATRGEHARSLRLVLPLANGAEWERAIRPARPTASRDTWLRLIRGLLDRLTVPDAVTGMALEVGATEPAAVRQGDLFDRGFATASAVDDAVARLAERSVLPLEPEIDGHPLVERRATWPSTAASTSTSKGGQVKDPAPRGARRAQRARGNWPDPPPEAPRLPPPPPLRSPMSMSMSMSDESPPSGGQGLTLQLLPEPRRLLVETVARRDHERPVRLRDRGGWREVALAAGPDRISGGRWETEPFAREYYRCVTDEGVPLWIYRDGRDGGWFLHGWWD